MEHIITLGSIILMWITWELFRLSASGFKIATSKKITEDFRLISSKQFKMNDYSYDKTLISFATMYSFIKNRYYHYEYGFINKNTSSFFFKYNIEHKGLVIRGTKLSKEIDMMYEYLEHVEKKLK